MTANNNLKAVAKLYDPRFRYTPAAQTDVAATWERFGFDLPANEQRRKRTMADLSAQPLDGRAQPGDAAELLQLRLVELQLS